MAIKNEVKVLFKKAKFMTKCICFLILYVSIQQSSIAQCNINHNKYDVLLQKYVSENGEVDYIHFKNADNDLADYVSYLASREPKNNCTKNEKLAYWINLYNAATLQLLLQNYPLKSINLLDKGKTWDVKRIKIGNKMYSLNDIENGIIRKGFKEPRIHFALNCGAKSCPPLYNHAFVAEKLNTQLDNRTKNFINNPSFNQIEKNKLSISKIFDWYGKDFGNIKNFINKYSTVKTTINTPNFNEYNWDLNQK